MQNRVEGGKSLFGEYITLRRGFYAIKSTRQSTRTQAEQSPSSLKKVREKQVLGIMPAGRRVPQPL